MGTNFYTAWHEGWPDELRKRVHLFKRSAEGSARRRLRFSWAADPVHVTVALLRMPRDAMPFEGEHIDVGGMLALMLLPDTIHDYSLVGIEFS